MGVRERKVENHLRKEVKKINGLSRKWVSPGVDGVPDQIVIFKSRVYFVEIKTTNGNLSVAQKREHDRLRESGAIVTTVYGNSGVDQFISHILNDTSKTPTTF